MGILLIYKILINLMNLITNPKSKILRVDSIILLIKAYMHLIINKPFKN